MGLPGRYDTTAAVIMISNPARITKSDEIYLRTIAIHQIDGEIITQRGD